VANMHANFEVSIFNRSRAMEGVPKFQKVGHVTPFGLILHFFVRSPSVQSACQIWSF